MKRNYKVIFLVGYPGCGKSTIGKKLAKATGFKFYDIDDEIESYEQMSIPEIFRRYGIKTFRKIEKETLEMVISAINRDKEDCIIATGGGLPCSYNNLDILKENGTVVYIRCGFWKLFWRLFFNWSRPNFRNKFTLYWKLKQKHLERESYYSCADFYIEDVEDLLVNIPYL